MIASRQRHARILGPDGQPMHRLAYDATVDKHRRQPPPSSTKDEDLILKPADPRKLVAEYREYRLSSGLPVDSAQQGNLQVVEINANG